MIRIRQVKVRIEKNSEEELKKQIDLKLKINISDISNIKIGKKSVDARKKNDVYECDLVLRNNITTSERPMGVFHPNPSLHHIKKENIGLIEVMGLAVLPSRLAKEIVLLKAAMLSGENLYAIPELTQHADWANKILAEYPHFNKTNAEAILKQEIGKVFLEVLEDAGVFKRNDEGKKAFEKFIDFLQYR